MRRSVVNWRVLQSLPAEGIKVFASQLHTHLTGRRAYTKHYRNGVELPELNRDNHFSPHYQEIRKLPRQVHVLPVRCLLMCRIADTPCTAPRARCRLFHRACLGVVRGPTASAVCWLTEPIEMPFDVDG